MGRLTTAAVLVVVGLALAAPRLKDPPKLALPIVGQWQLVEMDGAKSDFMTIEYFADGTTARTDKNARPGFRWRYTTDASVAPARLDYLYDDKPPDLCIFKVDGNTLTVCYSLGDKARPKEFGQPRTRTLVFQRVKQKD
jgi:uncharacterized protein (TIGR03067 family)